ncbi:MAG: bifunctional riboflavin kinase/FAD synthetase [Clostridia bacterium]|nr:bifunctional riboflavin kinase/FAD synthetase [Clostridia bacterium]
MRITDLRTNEIFTSLLPFSCAIALGNFDGVHIGHAELLKKTAQYAKENGCESAVFTFDTAPALSLGKSAKTLTPTAKKLEIFKSFGVSYAVLCDFDEIRDVCAEDFISDILIKKLHSVCTVCGFNYRFGKGAAGDYLLLEKKMKENGLFSITVEPVIYENESVSSTRIRKYIESGNIETANRLLGRYYEKSSKVETGKRIGRTIGVPTINQNFDKNEIIPLCGTYASFCRIDGKTYPSVTNVGSKPTVKDDGVINCETHIINFSGDLYQKTVNVCFLSYMRNERKFASLEELKAQIGKDIERSEELFRKERPK